MFLHTNYADPYLRRNVSCPIVSRRGPLQDDPSSGANRRPIIRTSPAVKIHTRDKICD